MTNPGNSTAAGSGRKKWARKELEIPRGSDSTSELLERLSTQGFVLSGPQREALNLLLGRPYRLEGRWGPKRTAYESARQKHIDKEIARLAADYFQLPTAIRRERWEKLQNMQGLTAPQKLWINGLQAGLDVTLPKAEQHGGQNIQHEIVGVISELFVMSPAARTQLRAAFLKRIHRNEHRWSEAAARLQQRYPQVTGLLPGFTKELIALNETSRRAAMQLRDRRAGFEPDHADVRVPSRRRRESRSETSDFNWWWVVYVCLAVAVFIGKFALRFSDSKKPETSTPRYNADSFRNLGIEIEPAIPPDEIERVRRGAKGNIAGDIGDFRRKKMMNEAGMNQEAQRDLNRQIEERNRSSREIDKMVNDIARQRLKEMEESMQRNKKLHEDLQKLNRDHNREMKQRIKEIMDRTKERNRQLFRNPNTGNPNFRNP